MEDNKIQLAFYGDDFTGSTDALESLSKAGLKTVLFLETPTQELLRQFNELDAIGIAGLTRAMIPSEMEEVLVFAFQSLKALHTRHVHYKICSTFDSSKEIGNIGTVIQCGQRIFHNSVVPIVVAAPHLGRYSAFGNLFARKSAGAKGTIYRLDRHPSMSKHPITPADEADLRLHLAKQFKGKSGLIDLVDLEQDVDAISQKVIALVEEGAQVIFFDAMYGNHMVKIGEAFERLIKTEKTLFSVGSSGVEKALGDYWSEKGTFLERNNWERIDSQDAILVLSGSCSPVTCKQIEWAVDHGFDEIMVDPDCLIHDNIEFRIETYCNSIISSLSEGRSVILHTCKGPDDPRIQVTKNYFESRKLTANEARIDTARQFGLLLGTAAKRALEQVPIKRLVIAGGDTSGHVAKHLGIEAVEMIAPIYAGAPLCIAYASQSPVHHMQINLKGGQVGEKTYFEVLRTGKIKDQIL